jgi:hypothetical protein
VGPISTPQRPEVAQIGVQLFTRYLYAFEATAALLVIAVVGAVVLVRRSRDPIEPDGDAWGEPDAAPDGGTAEPAPRGPESGADTAEAGQPEPAPVPPGSGPGEQEEVRA